MCIKLVMVRHTVRGFTLNYKNSLVLNFDTLKEIVCKYGSKPVIVRTSKNENK